MERTYDAIVAVARMVDITTIQITTETWRDLNQRKEPGDTFDDVIQRLLDSGEPDVEVRSEQPERHEDTHARDDDVDRVEEIVAEVSASWEDAPERLEARRDAARAALRLAFERGSLSRSEALRDIKPNHEVEGQNDTTWWKKNVQPMLREVGQHYPNRGYVVGDGKDE
jgi:predicted CopG family antitoxin